MKVYRYTTAEELNNILQNKTEDIGHSYIRNPSNTHRYKTNKKYLHFFKKKESIDYIKQFKRNEGTFYICEYDIPMLVLMMGRGVGIYRPLNYDDYMHRHVEYIVSVENFDPSWLKSYELDKTFGDSRTRNENIEQTI